MLDDEKCKRCNTIAASWYGRELRDCVKKAADKPAYQAAWTRAGEVLDQLENGEEVEWPTEMEVDFRRRAGLRMERVYWYITVRDFRQKFKLDAKAAGLQLRTFPDEDFGETTGVLMKADDGAPPPWPFRRIVLWSERVWTHKDIKMGAKARLRENEPDETFKALLAEEAKARPQDTPLATNKMVQ